MICVISTGVLLQNGEIVITTTNLNNANIRIISKAFGLIKKIHPVQDGK